MTENIQDKKLTISNRLLVNEAIRRGIEFQPLGDEKFKMIKGNKSYTVRPKNVSAGFNSRLARKITRYKFVTTSLLRSLGYSVPENSLFSEDEVERAWNWAQKILPVVLKPNDGIMGKLVFVNIDTYDEFKTCFEEIAEKRGHVLVEQFIKGKEYRFTFVKNEIIAVANRVPANVVGDGVHTIKELIQLKNKERKLRNNPIHKKLKRDKESKRILEKQGLSFSSIPKKGEQIFLRHNSNIATGGDAVDVTNIVNPEIKETIRKAIVDIPGLRVGGADVIIHRDNYHILEINAHAMLGMHHYPWEGEVQEVIPKVIDAMFPETGNQ